MSRVLYKMFQLFFPVENCVRNFYTAQMIRYVVERSIMLQLVNLRGSHGFDTAEESCVFRSCVQVDLNHFTIKLVDFVKINTEPFL